MRVLILSPIDTGGQGYRIAKGFERYTDWTVDTINAAPSTLGYPEQHGLRPTERRALMKRLYPQADVVHYRNSLVLRRQFSDDGKPAILHHHGTHFRTNHGPVAKQARTLGIVQIASTLDLAILEPDVEWLPSPYRLDELVRDPQPQDVIRIAHFPTDAVKKSSARFMTAVESLSQRHPIEVMTNLQRGRAVHTQWADIMALKAQADIYFDQVILGYGNNAIEAMGMGIPTIAGVADPSVSAEMLRRFGTLPFMEATEATIEQALEALIVSPDLRAEYGARGRAHVERFHDDAKVVAQLQEIYRAAPPSRKMQPYASPGWRERNGRAA